MKEQDNPHIFNLKVADLQRLIEIGVKKIIDKVLIPNEIDPLDKKLISFKEVLKIFSISKPTARSWEKYGHLPRSIKIGGKLYYYRDEIEKLFKNNV